MEKAVENVYTKEILEELFSLFNLDSQHKKLGDFENYVYEVYRDGEPYIFRVTHSSHRTEEEIIAELNWVNFLHKNEANVPGVYKSLNDNFIEKMDASDQTIFYGCLFSKAGGNAVRADAAEFNEQLFHAWGKEIGKLHRITRSYNRDSHRDHWYEDDLLNIEKYVPDQPLVIKNTQELINQLQGLPTSDRDYGLIHSDVHHGNFFYDGEQINIFDFDDACHLWYVSDIAIPLYYSCLSKFPDGSAADQRAFAEKFLNAFMGGYEEETESPENWRELLPLFLRLRDVTLYAVFHKKIAKADRTGNILKLMGQLKERIETKQSIVDISEGDKIF